MSILVNVGIGIVVYIIMGLLLVAYGMHGYKRFGYELTTKGFNRILLGGLLWPIAICLLIKLIHSGKTIEFFEELTNGYLKDGIIEEEEES